MYGLVGKNLKHSFSKEVHHLLGNQEYELFSSKSIEIFMQEHRCSIQGLNVTIPYKTNIIPYLDGLDLIAKETYSVNTVVNQNGKLIGYNTDYYGLKRMFGFNHINVKNKQILILGNGSVSKTVMKLMTDLNAKNVVRLCRTVRSGNDYPFSEYTKFIHYDIIINTTPVGMYPHNDDPMLIPLQEFSNLEYVIDLIYNPLRTKLMIEAELLGIKAISGLYMLIMQAVKAYELFFDKKIPLNVANKLYYKIYKKHLNIIFIGLPLSGKSKYSRLMSEISHKKGLDTDAIIEKEQNITIPKIFEKYGESYFRKLETKVVKDLYKLQNLIISTGGGLIENESSMNLLKQNGIIFFLFKNPEIIAKKKIHGRPLLKKSKDIIKLAKRRLPLYRKHSDYVINVTFDAQKHINEMKEYLNEYISR